MSWQFIWISLLSFRISTGATIQGSLASATNTTIHTDCEGLVSFDAEKEPDVNVDLICSDPECTRNRIITEIGDLLAVDTSLCGSCKLAVNTTAQNRLRLEVNTISSPPRSYIVHDGVGILFTEYLRSCFIAFPTNEMVIFMEGYTNIRISTEATNNDGLDSAFNKYIFTDCAGLFHFDYVKEPDVNVDLICSDSSRCTRNNIITEIGDLLAVDTSVCRSCKLVVNTTTQNRLRLDDIDTFNSLSQFYIVHNGVGTQFTEHLTSCFIAFPTNEFEIHMDWYTSFMISTEAINLDNLRSATSDSIFTDCVGVNPV